MKKRLEAELISIAHRVLKLKNKSEVDQLCKETQKLFETLTVLKFYQDNFELVKSEVSLEDLEEKLAKDYENETLADKTVNTTDPNVALKNDKKPLKKKEEKTKVSIQDFGEATELNTENNIENSSDSESILTPAFEPIFELEDESVEISSNSEPNISEKLEDIIGNYSQPVFVKTEVDDLFSNDDELQNENISESFNNTEKKEVAAESKSITIGLNDRIGFVQHLFNDSNEDFNRVMSQLNTFDTFEEAKNFINEMVIPDYDNWVGQEEYTERFMEIIEKKFL